jgi:hypothetical protein
LRDLNSDGQALDWLLIGTIIDSLFGYARGVALPPKSLDIKRISLPIMDNDFRTVRGRRLHEKIASFQEYITKTGGSTPEAFRQRLTPPK